MDKKLVFGLICLCLVNMVFLVREYVIKDVEAQQVICVPQEPRVTEYNNTYGDIGEHSVCMLKYMAIPDTSAACGVVHSGGAWVVSRAQYYSGTAPSCSVVCIDF